MKKGIPTPKQNKSNSILIDKQAKKNKQEVFREHINGTPFTAISTDEGKSWFLTLGKYRVTENNHTSVESITQWMETNKWELFASFCSIAARETVIELSNSKN